MVGSSSPQFSQESIATDQPATSTTEGWLVRIVGKRYGIAMLVLLTGWTFVGFVVSLKPILENALLIDHWRQLAFVTFINVFAFFFAVAVMRLLNHRHRGGSFIGRLGDGKKHWPVSLIGLTTLAAMVTPAVLATYFASEIGVENLDRSDAAPSASVRFWHAIVSSFYIFLGAASGLGALWVVGWIKGILVGCSRSSANYFPFEGKERDGWLFGKNQQSDQPTLMERLLTKLGVEPVDLQFAAYLTILAMLHWSFARLMTNSDTWLTSAPSMVVMLIWLTGMLLAGLGNVLDRWRLPVIPLLLLMATLWQIPWGTTRQLESVADSSENGFVKEVANGCAEETSLFGAENTSSQDRRNFVRKTTASWEDKAWLAVSRRMHDAGEKDKETGRTLVVVTCPGGGIHAAAWTAHVLEALAERYEGFAESVCVISGVSGGSVGTLCYVTRQHVDPIYEKAKEIRSDASVIDEQRLVSCRSDFENKKAIDLATESALEQIAYGVITDDLYGAVLPFMSLRDRGQRLEDSLSLRFPAELEPLTMGHWGDLAVEGELPIVIFNSTDAISGRRVLFDTIPTPRRNSNIGLSSRPLNYRELMGIDEDGNHHDVRPVTAVRTSATFPYVSPFTRPGVRSGLGNSVAICDGGYVDNEGIVTAVNWVDFLLRKREKEEKEYIGSVAEMGSDQKPQEVFRRILILRIEPSSARESNEPPPAGGLKGWFRWLVGPVEAIVNVRSASQSERGNLECDLAEAPLGGEIKMPEETKSESMGEPLLANKSKFGKSRAERAVDWDEKLDVYLNNEAAYVKSARSRKGKEEVEAKGIQMKEVYGYIARDDTSEKTDQSIALPEGWLDQKVVVVRVPFPDTGKIPPLNWKLSYKQKGWYRLAIKELFAAEGKEGSDQTIGKVLPTAMLQHLFELKEQDEEASVEPQPTAP